MTNITLLLSRSKRYCNFQGWKVKTVPITPNQLISQLQLERISRTQAEFTIKNTTKTSSSTRFSTLNQRSTRRREMMWIRGTIKFKFLRFIKPTWTRNLKSFLSTILRTTLRMEDQSLQMGLSIGRASCKISQRKETSITERARLTPRALKRITKRKPQLIGLCLKVWNTPI